MNGASINSLRCLLADPDTGTKAGISRVYDRIFWLEAVPLAFEQATLKEWREKVAARGGKLHMRVDHDDVTISVNWESRADRRLTPLQCSVSADIDSDHVYRIDANFDTMIEPVGLVETSSLEDQLLPVNMCRHYRQKSGKQFTVPAMHFQRPTGRYDEAALFASAESHLFLYSKKLKRHIKRTTTKDCRPTRLIKSLWLLNTERS